MADLTVLRTAVLKQKEQFQSRNGHSNFVFYGPNYRPIIGYNYVLGSPHNSIIFK